MSDIPLGSSFLRFFAQGGAVEAEPDKWAKDEPSMMIPVGGFGGATQEQPSSAVRAPDINPDNVQIDIPEFYPDLENPVDLDYDQMDTPASAEDTPSAYDQLLEADLRLRLERATPLERHLYEVTGMEPGLDRAGVLPWSGSKDSFDWQWSMPSLFYDWAKVANAPGAVVRGIPVSDEETVELGMNMMGSGMAISPSVEGAVAGMAIKNKGGNWLKGSAEALAERLQIRSPATPDEVAYNRFLDTKLTKYIRNDIGTPDDPLRNALDQGILPSESLLSRPIDLMEVEAERMGRSAKMNRSDAGFPVEGYATTELGRQYEDWADYGLSRAPARWFQDAAKKGDASKFEELEENPWIANLSPDETIYGYYSFLGPQGIADSMKGLREVLHETAEGTLPQHLGITPKALENMSLVQAVEKVAKVNQWRGQQADALKKAQQTSPAITPYREYDVIPFTGDPNVQGLGWKEIKLTDDSPEAIAAFNEALAFEGNSMSHSIGGYRTVHQREDGSYTRNSGKPTYGLGGFDAVKKGWVRLYSVRDAEAGANAVTIEVKTSAHPDNRSGKDEINQIKGISNGKPLEEYQPFIEDFIKSEDWGAVRDLHNTNLRHRDEFPDEYLTAAKLDPNQKYFSERELSDAFEADKDVNINPEGFRHGGEVSKTAWEELNGY